MSPKFYHGSLVKFKDETTARANGLSMMGPFSVVDIIPRKDYPEPILKICEYFFDDKTNEFSYRLADKEGNPVKLKNLETGNLIDSIFGESLLVETASN